MTPPSSRTPLEPDRRRATALWLAVALSHGLLLLAWMATAPRLRVTWPTERALLWVQSLSESHADEPAAAPTRPPPRMARPAPAHRAAALPAPARALPAPQPQAITLPAADAAPVAAATVQAPAPPASGPLLNNAATRAAIRQAGAQPLLAERAAAATGIPLVRVHEALHDDIKRAGKGDCLKGDYPGGGAGLLSLPALAMAAATGECAQ